MWDVGRKYDRSIGDVSDSRRQRGRSERRQRKVRRGGRTFFRKNVEISNKNIRKNSLHLYRPPKVRPKNLTIGGRYFYV